MRILLVPDVEGWAWDRRCRGIQKYSDYDVSIRYENGTTAEVLKEYDASLFMNWSGAPRAKMQNHWVFVANGNLRFEHEPHSKDFLKRCASREKNLSRARSVIPRVHGVITANPRLFGFLTDLNSTVRYLPTGVDTEIFYPEEQIRTSRLTIGWCGKESTADKWSPKGFAEILEPLMAKDLQVNWALNTREHANRLSAEEMRHWYNSIDLFLCTSCSEGGPTSLQEAMACGRGFVSTGVGLAGQLSEAGRCVPGYRNAEEASLVVNYLYSVLKDLTEDTEQVVEMGMRARRTILDRWDWRTLADTWCQVIGG